MIRRTGRFLRSNVIGLIAPFFALGGVAHALPGQNTVDSGDIVNNAVASTDIKTVARARWARVAGGTPAIVKGRGATGVTNPATASTP